MKKLSILELARARVPPVADMVVGMMRRDDDEGVMITVKKRLDGPPNTPYNKIMMNTTQTTTAPVTLFGKTLPLRGDNGVRASWARTDGNVKLYVFRGPDCIGNGPDQYTAKVSRVDENGHFDPIAAATASTLEAAEVKLLATLRRMGLKA